MTEFSFVSNNIDETITLGKTLADYLKKGSVIALIGELGTGKTTFVKGVAEGLGVATRDEVTSPTFVLIKEYKGNPCLYHIDLYRLKDPKEIEDIDYKEYLYGEGIAVIEWAEKIKQYLPSENLTVYIEHKDLNQRRFFLKAYGEDYKKVIEELKRRYSQKDGSCCPEVWRNIG